MYIRVHYDQDEVQVFTKKMNQQSVTGTISFDQLWMKLKCLLYTSVSQAIREQQGWAYGKIDQALTELYKEASEILVHLTVSFVKLAYYECLKLQSFCITYTNSLHCLGKRNNTCCM